MMPFSILQPRKLEVRPLKSPLSHIPNSKSRVVSGRLGSFRITSGISGRFESSRVVSGHFGSFRVVSGRLGSSSQSFVHVASCARKAPCRSPRRNPPSDAGAFLLESLVADRLLRRGIKSGTRGLEQKRASSQRSGPMSEFNLPFALGPCHKDPVAAIQSFVATAWGP